MKILQLVPRFPFPCDDGGKIGIANIFKQYSLQGAKVTLFSFNCENIPDSAINEAKQYGEVILFNKNTKNTIFKIAKTVLTNTPIFFERYKSNKLFQVLDSLIRQNNFDFIHADHTCMALIAAYLKEKYNIPFGLRLHNIEYKIWERYYQEQKNPFIKAYLRNQYNILKEKELQLIENADVNFAITENDKKEILKNVPNANIILATAGVDINEWQPRSFEEKNPYHLILATTFNWIPNVEALEWFLKYVLPILHKKNPNVKMFITGKNSPKWINNFNNYGATATGYLDDIKPLMNKCGIYVAPLFVGAGIRIKILEAMAMELPVVATSVSAEGINAGEENGLFIANNEQEYVDKILQLIGNIKLRKQAGINARKFIMKNFSWEFSVKKMYDEINNFN